VALSKNAIYRLLLLAIVVAGFALRLYHLGYHGFFCDEIYSVEVANGSADPELAQFDAARPLYFFLLKIWLAASYDEAWLRTLSIIFGLGNILLIAKLGNLLSGKKVALAAALLTALSPMEVHYSQQVRMYTMGTFLVIAGTILLLKTFESNKKLYLFSWALTRLLMVLTLPLTALVLIVDGLFALSQRGRTKLLPLFAACAAVLALLWTPFLLIILKAQTSPYDAWRFALDIPTPLNFLTLMIAFTASAVPLREIGDMPVYDIFTFIYCGVLALLLFAGLALALKQRKILWCTAWGLVPLAVLFIWSQFRAPLFITRYTMFAAPFVFIVFAYSFFRVMQRSRLLGVAIALVYGLGISSFLHYYYNHAVHEDWRPICQYLVEHEKPGDEIVFWNYHSQYLIGYYYQGKNHISDMGVVVQKTPVKIGNTTVKKYIVALDFDPRPGQRLWLIVRLSPAGWIRMHPIYKGVQNEIAKNFKIIGHNVVAGCDVYEVVAP